jgi:hypothetical protein
VRAQSLIETIIEYARRYAGTVLFAIPLGFIISWGINKFWAGSQLVVFVAVVICWLSGVIQVIVRDVRQGDENINAVFSDPRNWNSADLPIEFRSITHAMTLGEVVGRVGPYTRVTETGVVRYDLPSGGFVAVFPELPFNDTSRIKAIQLYRVAMQRPNGEGEAEGVK